MITLYAFIVKPTSNSESTNSIFFRKFFFDYLWGSLGCSVLLTKSQQICSPIKQTDLIGRFRFGCWHLMNKTFNGSKNFYGFVPWTLDLVWPLQGLCEVILIGILNDTRILSSRLASLVPTFCQATFRRGDIFFNKFNK